MTLASRELARWATAPAPIHFKIASRRTRVIWQACQWPLCGHFTSLSWTEMLQANLQICRLTTCQWKVSKFSTEQVHALPSVLRKLELKQGYILLKFMHAMESSKNSCCDSWVKQPPAVYTSHMGVCSIPAAPLPIQIPANAPWEISRRWPKSVSPCTHGGDLN